MGDTASRSNWHRLWAADAVSTLGDGASAAALPLLAVSLTTDPRLVAGVATATTLPWLLLALHVGLLADRVPRRRLMVGAQCTQAVLALTIAAIAVTHGGGIWPLYLVAFGLGTAETVFGTAAQSLLPDVVPAADLERTNGRLFATEAVSRQFVGPPLGSLLFTLARGLPFLVDALSFAVSAVLIAGVRTTRARTPGQPPPPIARPSVRDELMVGLRWLGGQHTMRTLAGLLLANSIATQLAMSTLVLFVVQELGLPRDRYGLLLAVGAVGAVLGGLVARRVVELIGVRGCIIVVSTGTGLAFIAIGTVRPGLIVLGLLLAVWTFGYTVWNVATLAWRQRQIPAELRGRVSGVFRLASFGGMPIGALLGGLVAAHVGLAAVWIVAGALRLLSLGAALPAMPRGAFDESGAGTAA